MKISDLFQNAIILGFLVSIAFVTGYFRYIGGDWISTLTVSDLFSLSWVVLPSAALAFIPGFLFGATRSSRVVTNEQLLNHVQNGSKYQRIIAATYFVVVGLSAFALPMFALQGNYFIPANKSALFLIIGGICVIGLGMSNFAFVRNESRAESSQFFLFGGAIIYVFCLGVAQGGAEFSKENNDMVYFPGNRTVCTSIVYIGERGLLIHDSNSPRVQFIKTASYVAVQRGVSCRGPGSIPVQDHRK